ncbi:TPA: class C sortase [Streptococcus suis]|nr:class C sortase [Streptococcus suis]HEM5085933.1 class C sortase [Streptococcus suis]HEP1831456.1 class C sortase [Streptococcus suis]
MDKKFKRVGHKKSNRGFIIIFIVGLLLFGYPLSGQIISFYQAYQSIGTYEKELAKIEPEEIKKRMELARAYNSSLISTSSTISYQDPFTKEQKDEGVAAYAKMLEIHEQIGYITIPRISQELPIYAGTQEVVLQKGVGHLEGSSLPVGGKNTHAVLTGHRGLPNSRLFTDLDKVKEGNKFYIHVLDKVLAYQVDQIKVVEPSDVSQIEIVEGRDYVTLITCTPYMINSHRMLVRGHRIPYVAKEEKTELNKGRKVVIIIILGIVLLFILILVYLYRKVKGKKSLEKNEAAKKETIKKL